MRSHLGIGLILLLPVAALAWRQNPPESDFEGRTERGWIRLRNFAGVQIAEDGTVRGTATGNPVVLEDTASGLTLTGKSMSIEFRRKGDYFEIQNATVAVGAHAILDSEAAYRNAVEFATAKNPAPSKPDAFARTTLDSESMNYKLTNDEGVLTLPEAMTAVSDSRGEMVRLNNEATTRTPFTQNLQFQGAKGRFTIGFRTLGERQVTDLRTGRIDGPATMKLVRTETVPDPDKPGSTKPETTNLTGRADLLEADLDGPQEPNLTATGNVQFEGDRGTLAGRVRGAKAVVTLDKTLKPIRYDFSGSPTTTRVRFKDGTR